MDRSWIEIDLGKFDFNYEKLKKLIPHDHKILQIVKADAYGHGSYEISKRALKNGATYLGVANIKEASFLRHLGIDAPILILSPSLESEIPEILENNVTVSISDYHFAQLLNEKAAEKNINQKVHINIDSGMGRSGFLIEDFLALQNEIIQLENLNFEGIFTHFSSAEDNEDYTLSQYKKFEEVLEKLLFTPKYIHASNSAGLVKYSFSKTNMVRLGLLSYGVYPSDELRKIVDVKEVMSFHSKISQIKKIPPNQYIGYNRTYLSKDEFLMAIIPVGYADGYDYLFSNKSNVWINGKLYPVIGKVSMDMITIKVGKDDANIGDEVILMGDCEYANANKLAQIINGSPYEILCQVGRRGKRIYTDSYGTIEVEPLSRRTFIPSDFENKKLNKIIEESLRERLQDKEISKAIYHEILKDIFYEQDKDVSYRKNFVHSIKFFEETKNNDYYKVETSLTYEKVLKETDFYVVCADNEKNLASYFLNPKVEYRWLLDNESILSNDAFELSHISVNDIKLDVKKSYENNCLIYKCSTKNIDQLLGKIVKFNIQSKTFYPKSQNQLSVFISEITQGVKIEFEYPNNFEVQAIPIFSGKHKFPTIRRKLSKLILETKLNEWTFPTSGIVFVYNNKT